MYKFLTHFRALYRVILFLTGTALLVPVQVVLYLPYVITRRLPANQSPIVRLWYKYVMWVFGIKATIINKRYLVKKQKIFLCNHISYVDILILGAHFNNFFVAKSDIAGWPLFGFLSKVGGTIFITRERRFVKQQLKLLQTHIEAKQSLLIFPEGTTSNGQEILPFKSSLLNSALEAKHKPVIQPLTLAYTHLNSRKMHVQSEFDHIAWYADMTLMPHLWRMLRQKNILAKVVIHPSVHITNDTNPKELSKQIHDQVEKSFQLLK